MSYQLHYPGQVHTWKLPPSRQRLFFFLLASGSLAFFFLPALWLTAQAHYSLDSGQIWLSYLFSPDLFLLNALPCFLLFWLVTLLSGRPWLGYLVSAGLTLVLAFINYYKIALRGDPLILSDLGLWSEALSITGHYQLDFTGTMALVLLSTLLGLFLLVALVPPKIKVLFPQGVPRTFLLGTLVVALFLPLLYSSSWIKETIKSREDRPLSVTQRYLTQGLWYPFLSSGVGTVGSPTDLGNPLEYLAVDQDHLDSTTALGEVSVVSIMLEAFCDYTDFPRLAEIPGVQEVYAPWHALEAESLSGELLTNIFAGGTVNSEWSYLTGMPQLVDFPDQPIYSYVWHFAQQDYLCLGSHPGTETFYDRNVVNQNLGYHSYYFSENYYGQFVPAEESYWNSDDILVDGILAQLEDALKVHRPVFSYSVSIQNHGPYSVSSEMEDPVIPESSGLSYETRGTLETYFHGVADTMAEMTRLRDSLEAMEEPVVLVLFGDHKPWAGNNNSILLELGSTLDTSTVQGFYDYYSTPYLIWANSAAKAVMGLDLVGEGGDISPHFLMNRLFTACGWTQPPEMYLSTQVMEVIPVVHNAGQLMYLIDGELTTQVPEEHRALVEEYLAVHQYRYQTAYDGS